MSEKTPRSRADLGRGTPAWVAPVYLAGLVMIFLGERVGVAVDGARWFITGPGLLAAVGATVVRLLPQYRAGGERKSIESLLAVSSLLGLFAVALYFATTGEGLEVLGLDSAADDTRQRWVDGMTVACAALALLGVVTTVFTELALAPMRQAERMEARRVRLAAVAGLSLGLSAVYGALFVYAAAEGLPDAKVDFSYFRTARPSDSTRKIVESLNEPVTVTAFFPQVNEVGAEVRGYLDELGQSTNNLKVEVQDRLMVPKLAAEMRVTQDGVVVLQKGKLKETLRIGSDMKRAQKKLKTLDGDFQGKLLKVMRARRTAYLTVGHGELNDVPKSGKATPGRGAKYLKELLRNQNYLIKDLGLSQGLGSEIPSDATVVMVLGPSEAFLAEEVATLKRYAEGGGKLLLALDPDALSSGDPATSASVPNPGATGSAAPPASSAGAPPVGPAASAKAAPSAAAPAPVASAKAPPSAPSADPAAAVAPPAAPRGGGGLAALAAIAGLEFDATLLAHETKHLRGRSNRSDRKLLFTNSFSSHASVSTLSQSSARTGVVLPGAGSLVRAKGSTEKVTFTIRSLSGTFADRDGDFSFDRKTEKKKVYNLAAAVTRPGPLSKPKADPAKKGKKDKVEDSLLPTDMRAFVIADADVLSDSALAQVMANRLLLVDAIRWLGGEESFAGEVSSEEDVAIEHTKEGDAMWFYSTIFGFPALVLGLGVWFSRRRRGGAR